MEKTWKPTAAGILCIIDGVICLLPGIAVALLFALLGSGWLTLVGAPLVIAGVTAIVGGVYAMRRRRWPLALAGAIIPLIGFGILVVLAIVVVGLSPLLLSDAPDIVPFNATSEEVINIIWGPNLNLYGVIGSTIFGILGILPIVFVIRGKREFK